MTNLFAKLRVYFWYRNFNLLWYFKNNLECLLFFLCRHFWRPAWLGVIRETDNPRAFPIFNPLTNGISVNSKNICKCVNLIPFCTS
jgi:hypothetical protein